MLARKISPPERGAQPARPEPSAARRAQGRWRTRGRLPTRGPRGEVWWWERPAPRGDTLLWEAVQRLHARRQSCCVTVHGLAEALAGIGHPIRRETLSRVLNGKQRTSWDTAEALSEILGVDLDDLLARRFGRTASGDGDDGGTVVPLDR